MWLKHTQPCSFFLLYTDESSVSPSFMFFIVTSTAGILFVCLFVFNLRCFFLFRLCFVCFWSIFLFVGVFLSSSTFDLSGPPYLWSMFRNLKQTKRKLSIHTVNFSVLSALKLTGLKPPSFHPHDWCDEPPAHALQPSDINNIHNIKTTNTSANLPWNTSKCPSYVFSVSH